MLTASMQPFYILDRATAYKLWGVMKAKSAQIQCGWRASDAAERERDTDVDNMY